MLFISLLLVGVVHVAEASYLTDKLEYNVEADGAVKTHIKAALASTKSVVRAAPKLVKIRTYEKREVQTETPTECVLPNMPKYVINLDRRTDRLHRLSAFLETDVASWMKQDMCRVTAIDGKTWTARDKPDESLVAPAVWTNVNEVTASGEQFLGETMTRLSVALLMSHALMWEVFLQQTNKQWGMFLEDDIEWIHPNLHDFLCDLMKSPRMSTDPYVEGVSPDLIQMQICRDDGAVTPSIEERLQEAEEMTREGKSVLRLQPNAQHCTGLYLLRREAAERLLHVTFPLTTQGQLDNNDMPMRANTTSFFVWPPPGEQTGSQQDSDGQTGGDHHPRPDVSIASSELIPDCTPAPNAGLMRQAALLNPIEVGVLPEPEVEALPEQEDAGAPPEPEAGAPAVQQEAGALPEPEK